MPNSRLAWPLTTDKAGDRAQVMALATSLGWLVQEKRICFNRLSAANNLLLGDGLNSVDLDASDSLAPPWPSLIIASGRRSVPVARWIKRQSGFKAKLVHIGRPWAPLSLFDLVISTEQYQLPARDNLLVNPLTLNRPDEAALAKAAERLHPELEGFRRPLIALLVGGNARPLVLTEKAACELGDRASALASKLGGSIAVATSRRTPDGAVDALFDRLPKANSCYRLKSGNESTYLGLLALADRFIVTGDSASMLSEACYTGKPTHVFPLPEQFDIRVAWARWLRQFCLGADEEKSGSLAAYFHLMVEVGMVASTRNMSVFHQKLEAEGLLAPLNETVAVGKVPSIGCFDTAVNRVKALF